jgi:hypothetical protein
MARKTPILLRRGLLTGDVVAVHRYSRETLPNGVEVLKAHHDGKQSVAADYDALVLEELLAAGAEDIVGILDLVADGANRALTNPQRDQVRCLRERLRAIAERHNERTEGRDG